MNLAYAASILLLFLFTVSAFAVHQARADTAAIWTNQSDYAPESTVLINGTGFDANATVALALTNPDGSVDAWNATTDGAGNLNTSYQIDGLAGEYLLTATEGANTAATTFTDSISIIVPTSASLNPIASPLSAGTTGVAWSGSVTASPSVPDGETVQLQSAPGGCSGTFATVATTSTSGGSGGFSGTFTAPSAGIYGMRAFFPTAVEFAGRHIWTTSTSSCQQIIVVPLTYSVFVTTSGLPNTVTFDVISTVVPHLCSPGCTGQPGGTTVTVTYPTPSTPTVSTTAAVSGGTGIQYVSTTSPISITSANDGQTFTFNYQTQYQVTYADTGCVLPVTDPSSEWVNSGGSATGVFPSTIDNGAGTRCIFVSDDRPATITGPTTVTGTYQIQYLLTVNASPSWIPSAFLTSGAAGWYNAGTTVSLQAASGPFTGPDSYRYFFNGWSVDGNPQTGNPVAVTMNGPHTATANYVTPQYLTFGWSGPASLSKGQTGTFTASYTIAANVALSNVKLQGGITVKATSIVISCDGQVVWSGASWPSNSGGVTLSACGGSNNLKINTSNNNNVLTLTFGSMAAGSSHNLSIQFNWASSSSGTYSLTGAWSASCTSAFGTLTTPYTNTGSVKVN